MKRNNGLRGVAAIALVCALLLASFASAFAEQTDRTLTVAYRSEAANLDPHNNQSLTAFSIEMLIYDRLVEKDASGNIVPSLATSWEEIDDVTIRFRLREDAFFHNGQKLTAEDVKYTIERAEVMPGSSSFMSAFDGAATSVVDEYTVDIKFHRPFAPAFNYLASARGCIVCKPAMEEMGSDAYGRSPIGSGPLKFESWVAGDNITLVRNEEYWSQKVAYEKFVARFITETTSRAIELETGGIDIAMHVAASDIERLSENPNTVVYNQPGYTFMMITLNQVGCDTLKDVRVRQALYEALDVLGMIDAVYGNTAVMADSIFSPQVSGHVAVGADQYNPEHAKQLLDEAGYDYGTVLELITTDSSEQISVCEIARNMWEQIGVKVNIVTYDMATLTDKVSSGNYQMQISTTSPSSGDPDHAMWEWKDTRMGLNATEEMQELIQKGASLYDQAERNDIYAELQRLCWDYYGELPLAFINVIYGSRADILNMDVHPGNVPNFSRIAFKG